MNKKITIILMALVLLGMGGLSVSAQGISLSAGGGLTLGNTFYSDKPTRATNSAGTTLYGVSRNELGIGVFGFLDATYAELSFGYKQEFIRGTTDTGLAREGSRSSWNIGLLGKYPLLYLGGFDIYPLLGVQYTIVTALEINGYEYDNLSESNALWIMFGGGGDYFFSDALFIRGQVLYGFMMKNEQQKDYSYAYSYLVHGPSIKIALGYKFW